MDTSKKYIEMCYSKEIQELSKRETGNYYYQIKDDGETCKGVFICWNGLKPNGGYHNWNNDWYFPENCIWLPRQDQLQEMVVFPKDISCSGWLSRLQCFYGNEYFDKGRDCKSMEELWLGFVMKEKYNKIWDDKKEKWAI